jgi:hypothetical protein
MIVYFHKYILYYLSNSKNDNILFMFTIQQLLQPNDFQISHGSLHGSFFGIHSWTKHTLRHWVCAENIYNWYLCDINILLPNNEETEGFIFFFFEKAN